LDEEHRIRLQKGITVEQKYSRFISVEHVNKTGTKVRVQAGEGRNHFVKNLFSTLGYSVTELHRVSIGNLSADDIPLGAYKKIPASQIEIILTNTK
jgi:23S rRNA pseudouridine2605 synthase